VARVRLLASEHFRLGIRFRPGLKDADRRRDERVLDRGQLGDVRRPVTGLSLALTSRRGPASDMTKAPDSRCRLTRRDLLRDCSSKTVLRAGRSPVRPDGTIPCADEHFDQHVPVRR